MYLVAKFGDHISYRTGDISSYINSYMDTLKLVEPPASSRYIARFFKSGIPIYNSKVSGTLAEKREEADHRQLQSVMHFMQTQ